jgi:hypothetical protein
MNAKKAFALLAVTREKGIEKSKKCLREINLTFRMSCQKAKASKTFDVFFVEKKKNLLSFSWLDFQFRSEEIVSAKLFSGSEPKRRNRQKGKKIKITNA